MELSGPNSAKPSSSLSAKAEQTSQSEETMDISYLGFTEVLTLCLMVS